VLPLPSDHANSHNHDSDASHLEQLKTPDASSPFTLGTSSGTGNGVEDEHALSSPSYTFFSGSWTPRAPRRVEDAVISAERLLTSRSGLVPPFGARWICVASDVRDRRVYLAHRIGADRVLRADSAEKLVQRISSFAFDTSCRSVRRARGLDDRSNRWAGRFK